MRKKILKNEIKKITDPSVYYSGNYKKRNDLLLSFLEPYIPEECVVLDIAAGSGYIASELLKNKKISKYYWNDINEIIIEDVKSRINDEKLEFAIFNANKPKINFDKINLFISLSLEHIKNDINLLKKLKTGTLIAICSPNFNSFQHFRHFEKLEDFENRYEDLIDILGSATIYNRKSKTKLIKKYIICGTKKDEK